MKYLNNFYSQVPIRSEALLDTTNTAFTSDFGSRDDVESKIIICVTDGRSNIKHSPYTVKTANNKLKKAITTVSSINMAVVNLNN